MTLTMRDDAKVSRRRKRPKQRRQPKRKFSGNQRGPEAKGRQPAPRQRRVTRKTAAAEILRTQKWIPRTRNRNRRRGSRSPNPRRKPKMKGLVWRLTITDHLLRREWILFILTYRLAFVGIF
jgi:hypothetical protein